VADLVQENRNLELLVAGDASALEQAKNHARNTGIKQLVSFLGYVRGEEKCFALLSSQLFVLPSYHGESCPVSLLEVNGLLFTSGVNTSWRDSRGHGRQ